jgi:hypothetical protein
MEKRLEINQNLFQPYQAIHVSDQLKVRYFKPLAYTEKEREDPLAGGDEQSFYLMNSSPHKLQLMPLDSATYIQPNPSGCLIWEN